MGVWGVTAAPVCVCVCVCVCVGVCGGGVNINLAFQAYLNKDYN